MPQPPASPMTAAERDAAITTLYGTTPPAELAARLGMSLASIYRHASRLKVSNKPAGNASHDVRRLLAEGAKRPDGVRSADVAKVLGLDIDKVSDTACKMARAGKLCRVQISYRNVRYCDTKHAAAALAQRLGLAKPDASAAARPTTAAARKATTVTAPATTRGPAHLPGEPVITASTKWTIAPPPPQRALRSNTYLMAG